MRRQQERYIEAGYDVIVVGGGMAGTCAALAAAYRSGQLGILTLPQSEAKARWFEQRALSAENLPE